MKTLLTNSVLLTPVTQTQIVEGLLSDMEYASDMVEAHFSSGEIRLGERWARVYHNAAERVLALTGTDPRLMV